MSALTWNNLSRQLEEFQITERQYEELCGGHKMHKHRAEWVQLDVLKLKQGPNFMGDKNLEPQDEMVHI